MARLAIDQILISDKTRVRVKIDSKIVDEYSVAMQNGAIFPGVTVFAEKGSQRYFLADGETRIMACIKIGKKTVGVDIKEGGVHEALAYALSANSTHGQRRTIADKHHAVELALGDPHYADWSLSQIGELCRVSHQFVSKLREEQNEAAAGNVTDNKRPRREKPTQAEVDLKLFRGAVAVFKGFPYSGDGLAQRLGLNPDDETDVTFCITWLEESQGSFVKKK